MSYLQQPITWPSWKFGVLKLAMASAGVLLGVYFADFWRGLLPIVWIVCVVASALATVWGLQSLREQR